MIQRGTRSTSDCRRDNWRRYSAMYKSINSLVTRCIGYRVPKQQAGP